MPDDEWLILGVDPAPSKVTVAFDGKRFHAWEPDQVRAALGEVIADRDRVLVLWDAPLRMDEGSFYRRQVDTLAQERIQTWGDQVEPKAIGVAPAAACPHNLLSMHVLGLPMGAPQLGLKLLQDPSVLAKPGRYVAEVHPAVAMGAWFADTARFGDVEHGRPFDRWEREARSKILSGRRMPVYKDRLGGSRLIARSLLALEQIASVSPTYSQVADAWDDIRLRSPEVKDDALDAWVAWILGRLLLGDRAFLWDGVNDAGGSPSEGHGYYVMPTQRVAT